jgi:hypothetical protein
MSNYDPTSPQKPKEGQSGGMAAAGQVTLAPPGVSQEKFIIP